MIRTVPAHRGEQAADNPVLMYVWMGERRSLMHRYLGIDYGTKRIGLAIGDDDAKIASPIDTIVAQSDPNDHVRAVLSAAGAYDIDAFVIGLPVNMDDTEGEQAKITRQFGDKLAVTSGLDVHYHDERLSSHAAQELLRPAELTRRKRKAVEDSVAAQVILQGFLDTLHGSDGNE